MKARLVKIGNSQGIRIPKPLLEQSGLSDEVELGVDDAEAFRPPHNRSTSIPPSTITTWPVE